MNNNINTTYLQDRIRGSLVGGAIGDAWGYPVEFLSYESITSHYGEKGIASLELDSVVGKAIVSDDTQMTLFTAMGMINAHSSKSDYIASITQAYIDWYYTQMWTNSSRRPTCFIAQLPQLQVCRAPGNTCMSALYSLSQDSKVINNSKGCGGVMRIAPIPLYALAHRCFNRVNDVARLAGDAAMVTHKHVLGYIPAAFVAHLIYNLAADGKPTRQSLVRYASEAVNTLHALYPLCGDAIESFAAMINRAISLVDTDAGLDDYEAIDTIGEGWVADEAAAVAFYCVYKYFNNFEQAMIAAANHDGDSDSTAAIAGNILGAALGYNAISPQLKSDVEMHDLIVKIADGLLDGRLDS